MLANIEYKCYTCGNTKIIYQLLRKSPTLICEKCHKSMEQGLTGTPNLKSADFTILS